MLSEDDPGTLPDVPGSNFDVRVALGFDREGRVQAVSADSAYWLHPSFKTAALRPPRDEVQKPYNPIPHAEECVTQASIRSLRKLGYDARLEP